VSYTPAGTIAWPAGVPAFTGNSGTVPAETISWPSAVPTFSGSALGTHTHTVTANGSNSAPTFTGTPVTPTGSASAPAFTGTQFDNRSTFKRVIFCKKS
jgi:hypothetical protein